MLHLLQQDLLLSEQLVFFPLGISTLGYVFYRQQEGRGRAVLVEHLSRVEEHHAPADGWEFVLHLIGLDGAVFRDHIFEDSPQSRNVPLPIAQQVELSALRVPRLHRESPVKGSTRGNYAQVSIENDKRLPNGVNDGLRQGMPVRHGGQRVVIRHARRILIYLKNVLSTTARRLTRGRAGRNKPLNCRGLAIHQSSPSLA